METYFPDGRRANDGLCHQIENVVTVVRVTFDAGMIPTIGQVRQAAQTKFEVIEIVRHTQRSFNLKIRTLGTFSKSVLQRITGSDQAFVDDQKAIVT